ncbi:MAG: hypothetical protein R3B97_16945 [Dehalococcoidia bacterium]
MPSDLFSHCASVVRRTEAADMGCLEDAFASNDLIVVPRPAKVLFPEYAMLVSSFGTGTVISIEAEFTDWVHTNRPKKHWPAQRQLPRPTRRAHFEKHQSAWSAPRSRYLAWICAR